MTKKAAAIFFWLAFGTSPVPVPSLSLTNQRILAVFWGASLGILIMDWRSGKLNAPRDPPFNHPTTADQMELDEEDDEESSYTHIPPARRPTNDNNANNDNSPNSPFADTNRYTTNYNNTSTVYSPGVLPVSAGGAGGGAAPRASMDAYGAFSDPAPSGFAAPASASGGYTSTTTTAAAAPVLPEPDMGPRVSRTMQYADPYAAVRAQIAGGGAGVSGVSTPPSYESYQGYR